MERWPSAGPLVNRRGEALVGAMIASLISYNITDPFVIISSYFGGTAWICRELSYPSTRIELKT